MAGMVFPREDQLCTLAGQLAPERTFLLKKSCQKREVLDLLIGKLAESEKITSAEELATGVYEREQLMSTGIGLGIAIPHVRLNSVLDMVAAAALVPKGVEDYESLDSIPVRMVLLIAARQDQQAEYLRMLSALSIKLKTDQYREQLFACSTATEFYDRLVEAQK